MVITPGDGLYHSEEYFFRYVELKTLSIDATVCLICFENNIYGNKPAFICLDDEKIISLVVEVSSVR